MSTSTAMSLGVWSSNEISAAPAGGQNRANGQSSRAGDPPRLSRRRASGAMAFAERDRRDADDLDDRHIGYLRRLRVAALRLRLVATADPGGALRHNQSDCRLQSG